MLSLLPWILIWISVFAPFAAVAWKLCRFLDAATATVEAWQDDLNRNFRFKSEAEKCFAEGATLCRNLAEKAARESGAAGRGRP